MTQPTQAQIEAAAKALYGDHGRLPSDKAMAMAKTALTAAAEVDEAKYYKTIMGEYEKPIYNSPNNRVRAAVASTIERCAQLIKELADQCNSTLGCAPYARAKLLDAEAAIRALKEKP